MFIMHLLSQVERMDINATPTVQEMQRSALWHDLSNSETHLSAKEHNPFGHTVEQAGSLAVRSATKAAVEALVSPTYVQAANALSIEKIKEVMKPHLDTIVSDVLMDQLVQYVSQAYADYCSQLKNAYVETTKTFESFVTKTQDHVEELVTGCDHRASFSDMAKNVKHDFHTFGFYRTCKGYYNHAKVEVSKMMMRAKTWYEETAQSVSKAWNKVSSFFGSFWH